VTVLQLDPDDHVILLNMHHVISDGWSLGVLVGELSVLYAAFDTGEASPLPPLPIQFADYAAWQRDWLQGEELDRQLDYWKRQLANVAPLQLATDRRRPVTQSFRGATVSMSMPREVSDRLRELGRREGTTLFMTLLAVFQTLLARYTGQEDIAVGTAIANRNHAAIESLIGFFVNTLVMRTSASGDPPFRELLRRTRETCLGAYAHQDLPFEKLVEELAPLRDLSREPLFQVMFALQNAPMPRQEVSGDLQLTPFRLDYTTAKFDLTVFLWETPDGLTGLFEYATDLFDRDAIEQLALHYRTFLESAAENPDLRLSQFPFDAAAAPPQAVEEVGEL
jgi:hypothetical protein